MCSPIDYADSIVAANSTIAIIASLDHAIRPVVPQRTTKRKTGVESFQAARSVKPHVKLCRLLWQSHILETLVEKKTNRQLCRQFGRVTFSRLWSNSRPNVKLLGLLGRVTFYNLRL